MVTHPLVSVFSDVPAAPGLAARRLAEAGIPVFPCGAGGKRPLPGSSGFHDATTNLGQVADWWGRFPNANAAIPTGRASGVVVVDVDVHGVNGFEAFGRARAAGLLPVPLAVVRTPSGGMHLYYPVATDAEQRSWQAGKVGIDYRGDGGYIIVPPSRVRVDGVRRAYEVFQLHPDVSMPVDSGRLRDFLDPRTVIQRPRRDHRAEQADVSRLAGWLAQQTTDRNLKLFWAACRLAEGNVPIEDALDAFRAVERPGFGQREITRTVHSAYRSTHPTVTRPAPFERRVPVRASPAVRGL
ncbi:MAG: bifunctional DNA primase/polymerase [Salana multivorans]|nr:bifunctional DNA primase/polymerase [Salana multivorans]